MGRVDLIKGYWNPKRKMWVTMHFSEMHVIKDVLANCFCACNSLPHHALNARAVEEMWRYIALVGTLVSMHGFNSLNCSVTPYFLLIDHFLCQLSTF